MIVLLARVRPGYDPYGWLVWGKLSIHWKLETNFLPMFVMTRKRFWLSFTRVARPDGPRA